MSATTTLPTTPEKALVPASTNSRHYAKHKSRVWLRSIALFCDAIALAIAIAAAASVHRWEFAVLAIPILLWSIIWNTAEFITLCVNRRGIHPIANLVIDLLQVFKLAVAAVFILMWYNEYDGGSPDGPMCKTGNLYSFNGHYSPPIDCGMWRAGLICGLFCMAAFICHFVLFILDCIATHRWRKTRRQQRAAQQQVTYAMYTQPVGMAPGPQMHQGHVSMPPPPPGMVYVAMPQQPQYQPNYAPVAQPV